MTMRVVIVGVGGVGTRLARELPMYLSRRHPGAEVVLVDGDHFEPKNRDRQDFDAGGVGVNKARFWAEKVAADYPELRVTYRDTFVTRHNVDMYVPEGSHVFCAVDNHASRLLLSERVSSMRDGVLVSGGNDYHDGNVQVHVRRGGVDLTPPITYLHREIADPADPRHGKNPAEMSCEELAAASTPQLQFANGMVAQLMLSAFWNVSEGVEPPYSEVYFDLKRGTQRPVLRKTVTQQKEDGSATAATGAGGAALADRAGSVSPAG